MRIELAGNWKLSDGQKSLHLNCDLPGDNYSALLKEKKIVDPYFGKNENDLSRSMKPDDFNFFKEFHNIEIRYEKRLHAKYYANEKSAILTSMNLYNYSQDNNIEAGILTNKTMIGNLTNNFVTNVTGQDSLEVQTTTYFARVIEQSELLFQKVPHFEKTMLGLSKKYTTSNIEIDKLSEFFDKKTKPDSNFQKESFMNKSSGSQFMNQQVINPAGFCIRTGVKIPFNHDHPLSEDAFQSWKKYSKVDFPENFCHFSGEPSNKQTSFARPILRKNWNKAKEIHHL